MKIVIVTGSAHRHGTAATLTDQFQRGAADAGHEVFRFDAAFQNVHPCIGCDKCIRTGECTFEADDMKELNRTFSRPTRSSSSRRSIILTSTPSSRRSSTAFMPTMKR